MAISKARKLEHAKSLYGGVFGADMPASLTLEFFDKAAEQAYIATLYYWFDNIYPRAFAPYAALRRGYPSASPKYQRYKRKLTSIDNMSRPHFVVSGPAGPIRKRGLMPHKPNWKDFTTARPRREPRVKRTREGMIASIVVNVPLYVRQNRYVPNMANLATRLTEKDYEELDAVFDRTLMQLLGISGSIGRSA